MDAYSVAARIPEMLFMIFAGGALGSAFIPLFMSRLSRDDEAGAWGLASAVITDLIVLLLPLSLLSIVVAPWMVRTWVAPEFPPAMQAQTAKLLRIMLLSPTIFGVSGILMGVLNSYQAFLLPALGASIYNLALILGAIWGGRAGGDITRVAVASVVGAAAHLLLQIVALFAKRRPFRYRLRLGLSDPGVRKVGLLMLPRMLGMAAVQINFVVTNNLASGLMIGAASALTYAWSLVLLPQGIFAQALGITAFPTLSEQAARGELQQLRRTIANNLQVLVALLLPATAGLILLRRPVVALLMERGEFGAAATDEVAWALGLFALGLTAHGAIEILARVFYALHDTWVPALAAAGAVLLNVLLGLSLPPLFEQWGWPPHGGLALANSLAALVETVALLLLLQRRIGRTFGGARGSLADLLGRPLLATLGMSVVVAMWLRLAPVSVPLQALGGIGLGLTTYVIVGWWLGVEALRDVQRRIVARFLPQHTT